MMPLVAASDSVAIALAFLGGYHARFVWHVLPGMLLLGLGAGMALNPVLLAAMSDVEAADSGLASGIVNTAFMMGGAVGLAVLASLAAYRTGHLLALGEAHAVALNGGYRIAFAGGAIFAVIAALLGAFWVRNAARPQAEAETAASI